MGVQQRGAWQNWFNFPGGKAEPGESDADATAREVAEETGIVLSPDSYKLLGELIIIDKRPEIPTVGKVAIMGAHLSEEMPLVAGRGEFDPIWINPKDRHILLNMPSDVPRWLPLVFREPFQPFVCSRTIDEGGGHRFETAFWLSDEHFEPVDEFASNL